MLSSHIGGRSGKQLDWTILGLMVPACCQFADFGWLLKSSPVCEADWRVRFTEWHLGARLSKQACVSTETMEDQVPR